VTGCNDMQDAASVMILNPRSRRERTKRREIIQSYSEQPIVTKPHGRKGMPRIACQ
jgi:hypothetical protein